MDYKCYTSNVFTSSPFNGARIPVFPHAEGLSDHQMKILANEMNASDTVFIFPNGSDSSRKLRIFNTAKQEVKSATHTILAATHVLSSIGDISLKNNSSIILNEKDQSTEAYISASDGKLGMITQSYKTQAVIDRFVPPTDELARMLSLIPADIGFDHFTPLIVSCGTSYGIPYLIVPVKSYIAVRAARFNFDAWSQSTAPSSAAQGIFLFSNNTDNNVADFHGRLMGPDIGFNDDPPIAPVIPDFANYLCSHSHIQKGTHVFTVQRGAHDARQSYLHLEMDNRGEKDLTLRVGGEAILTMESTISV